ncbi:programmed cell death 1 ligand 1-like [Oreochromis niloticus]|uniref:programmed cell death 1 ligand 1-like n=1 Tax=Oreochromis niloticus TaxID=8128 RepID=UPI000DF15DD9|nr:programmed cell death 1 ligand 1-like [Oreochromis niloticus]
MAGIKCVVFLVVLIFQWTHARGDTEVSCVYMENCTLACSYEGADVVIHWHQVSAGNLPVHSFFHNQDQPENSAQRFRGRASTFKDQISRGNASVLLTGVKVQDEGRYRCYTSTINGNKESFIKLKIDAPVHKVDVHQVENGITCRSEGIYPKPELTWSTSPPSSLTFKNTTTVQQTEQQLYNISSSLILSGSDHDLNFICTVSTRRNRKSEIVLNGTVTNYTVSEKWKQHVKKLSESGSLTLQDISADQEGTYTCEVSDAEETTISLRSVMIHKAPHRSGGKKMRVPSTFLVRNQRALPSRAIIG